MKYPLTRFVFDRKKQATKKKKASVQVEILLKGKKKYISTGVSVYKDEWNVKHHVVNCMDSFEKNARIEAFKKIIDSYIRKLMEDQEPFDWNEFERFITKADEKRETFIEYAARRIEERADIQESTRKSHRKLISSLLEYKKIKTFDDLTGANLLSYYEWLQARLIEKIGDDGRPYYVKMSTHTIWDYMKFLKHYIHDAIAHELIDYDPCVAVKVKRGKPASDRWLSVDEVEMLSKAKMPNGSITRVRDLFILSCYTGLAFCDLMDFSPKKLEKDGDYTYLYGRRMKTGEEYVVLVLPQAEKILKKYDYKLPQYTNQQFNQRLKVAVKEAGIKKKVSSHWGRHTAAMMFLNAGVRIEVVSRALGHSTITETQRTYSRVLKKTVVAEMQRML